MPVASPTQWGAGGLAELTSKARRACRTCQPVHAAPYLMGLPLAPAPTNLQSSSSATTHVVLVVNTSNPDVVAKAFSNGTMLANLIKPTGVNIVPTTVEVRTHPPFNVF